MSHCYWISVANGEKNGVQVQCGKTAGAKRGTGRDTHRDGVEQLSWRDLRSRGQHNGRRRWFHTRLIIGPTDSPATWWRSDPRWTYSPTRATRGTRQTTTLMFHDCATGAADRKGGRVVSPGCRPRRQWQRSSGCPSYGVKNTITCNRLQSHLGRGFKTSSSVV